MLHGIKNFFATIGMGALKIIEGFIGVNENVIDGLVSIVGFIGGLFSSRFQDCLGEFIKKDWVGDTTAKWYEEGWLKNVNKYSYISHESTAEQAAQNIQNMEAQGYVPGSSSTTEIPDPTPFATPVPTSGSSSSSPTYNVTTKPVVISENTPSTEQPVLDDVINNIIIDNDQQPTTGINTRTGTTTNEVIRHTVQTSSQVLNTFGYVSNSVSTMATKSMIPTSSSPILSSATKE